MAAQFWTALPLFLLAAAGFDVDPDDGAGAQQAESESAPPQQDHAGQISLERVVIIRVPRTSRAASLSQPTRDSDIRCLRADSLVGVRVSQSGELALLTDGGWYRAEMDESCDSRQFYSGFYVAKPKDGLFCAHREELRARSGTICQVSGFTRASH